MNIHGISSSTYISGSLETSWIMGKQPIFGYHIKGFFHIFMYTHTSSIVNFSEMMLILIIITNINFLVHMVHFLDIIKNFDFSKDILRIQKSKDITKYYRNIKWYWVSYKSLGKLERYKKTFSFRNPWFIHFMFSNCQNLLCTLLSYNHPIPILSETLGFLLNSFAIFF